MIEDASVDTETEAEVEIDPVCGATVDVDDAAQHALAVSFEGRSYAFCGRACRDRFGASPLRFAAAGRSQP